MHSREPASGVSSSPSSSRRVATLRAHCPAPQFDFLSSSMRCFFALRQAGEILPEHTYEALARSAARAAQGPVAEQVLQAMQEDGWPPNSVVLSMTVIAHARVSSRRVARALRVLTLLVVALCAVRPDPQGAGADELDARRQHAHRLAVLPLLRAVRGQVRTASALPGAPPRCSRRLLAGRDTAWICTSRSWRTCTAPVAPSTWR